MNELSKKVIAKMEKQEFCQSILHKPIKQCIDEFGLEAARDAIEWYSMMISRELAEEYARINLFKKELNCDQSVDKIHAA